MTQNEKKTNNELAAKENGKNKSFINLKNILKLLLDIGFDSFIFTICVLYAINNIIPNSWFESINNIFNNRLILFIFILFLVGFFILLIIRGKYENTILKFINDKIMPDINDFSLLLIKYLMQTIFVAEAYLVYKYDTPNSEFFTKIIDFSIAFAILIIVIPIFNMIFFNPTRQDGKKMDGESCITEPGSSNQEN